MRRFLALFLAVLLLPSGALAAGLHEVPAPTVDVLPAPDTPVVEIPVDRSAQVTMIATPGAAAGVARSLAPTLPQEREALRALLGMSDGGPVQIRVGYGKEQFQALQPPTSRVPGWAAGVAYPGLGLIVLDAQASGRSGDPGSVLRHELAHVALGRLIQGHVPSWFTEGFAMHYAGEWSLSRSTTLARATAAKALIPVEDLENGWPSSPTDVDLAYAQSASLVAYLAGAGDGRVLQRLVARLHEGEGFGEALREAYGQPAIVLEHDWKQALRGRYGWLPVFLDHELLWGWAAVLLVVGAWRVRRHRRRRLAEMPEEPDEPEELEEREELPFHAPPHGTPHGADPVRRPEPPVFLVISEDPKDDEDREPGSTRLN